MSLEIGLRNKKILVTGAAGFIGSNICLYLQKTYPTCEIVALDSFKTDSFFSNGNPYSYGSYKNLFGFNGTLLSLDVTNKDDLNYLNEKFEFDYIFHQAAISDTTVQEQDLMIKTNVNAFEDLIKIAIEHNANIVYASSAATYGDAKSPQKVGNEQPNNVYGFSKLMMDNIARKYINKKLDISIVGLRYFNVYGKNEYYKQKTASMVLQFGHQLLSKKKPRLFENSEKIFRDFVYIEDVMQANILAANATNSGIYNVGSGQERSFKDIVDILQKELDTKLDIEYIKNPYIGSYQFHTKADISDTTENLGYNPKYSLEEGIKDYIPYIKDIYNKEVANAK
ncbi:MAG: ADP-glyceromanno-heptose 6-epimerase [Campylobacterota bacterium]